IRQKSGRAFIPKTYLRLGPYSGIATELNAVVPGRDLLHIRQRKIQEREDEARRSQSWRVMELFIISLMHSRRRTCTDPSGTFLARLSLGTMRLTTPTAKPGPKSSFGMKTSFCERKSIAPRCSRKLSVLRSPYGSF